MNRRDALGSMAAVGFGASFPSGARAAPEHGRYASFSAALGKALKDASRSTTWGIG